MTVKTSRHRPLAVEEEDIVNLSGGPEIPADPIDTGGDEPYAGFSNAITFTDGGNAEGVEFSDFLNELPPDVRAEFEEMQEAMTDPEMMEMFEGMEGSGQP